MELKNKAISAIKWTGLSSIVTASVQFVQLGVFARLLSAHDFGLFAIAFVIVGLSQLLLDMGTSNAIIYKQDVTKKELDSLYVFNLITGAVLFLFVFGLSYPTAAFYGEPKLVGIIQLTAVTFLVQPIGQQFYVLLKKEMRFNSIAKRDILSKCTNLVVSSVLAYRGYGVYAMVWGYLVGYIVNSIFLVWTGVKYHMPGFYFNFAQIRPFLRFGLYQMGESFINYFNTNLDSMLIGKLLGAVPLGIFNVAKNLALKPYQIINPIVTQVAFPLMAKVQHDKQVMRNIFQRMLNNLAAINIPLHLLMILFATPLLYVTLGAGWSHATTPFQYLCLYGMMRAINNPVGALLLANGNVKFSFMWNLLIMVITPPVILAGSNWGNVGIAIGLLSIQVVFLFVGWKWIIYRLLALPLGAYLKDIYRPLSAALIMLACCLPIEFYVENIILKISLGGVVACASYLTASRWLNNRFFADLLHQISEIYARLSKKTLS